MSGVYSDDIAICRDEVVFRLAMPCDNDVYNICIVLMKQNNLQFPVDADEALNLYTYVFGVKYNIC